MPDETVLTLSFLTSLAILPGLIWQRRFPTGGAGPFLRAGLAGLLSFLVWDLVTHGFEPVTSAIELLRDEMDWDPARPVATFAAVFLVGLAVGLGLLVWHETSLRRGYPEFAGSDHPGPSVGPGAMAATEVGSQPPRTRARNLSLRVAAGIGLHGALVGLAFGSHSERDEIAFPIMLAIGLALYACAEGFAFNNLFATNSASPSLPFRGLLGVIGGAPVFLATVAGMYLTDDLVNVALSSLAAGALTYTVIRLITSTSARAKQLLLYGGLLTGLAAGFLADVVIISLLGSID